MCGVGEEVSSGEFGETGGASGVCVSTRGQRDGAAVVEKEKRGDAYKDGNQDTVGSGRDGEPERGASAWFRRRI